MCSKGEYAQLPASMNKCNLITWGFVLGIVQDIYCTPQDTTVCVRGVLISSTWLCLGSIIQGQCYSSPCYVDE